MLVVDDVVVVVVVFLLVAISALSVRYGGARDQTLDGSHGSQDACR